MQDLIKQEQFEIEVLDRLRSGRFLENLVFVGGTMLRLCYGLERFSVDLDFWVVKDIDFSDFYKKLKEFFRKYYMIKDAKDKFYTMLFEIKSGNYPRGLKVEIRKQKARVKTDMAIAFSRYSNIQVLLRCLSLEEMMKAKISAFLDRKEIRDIFDIEFLVKRGIELNAHTAKLREVLKAMDSLTKSDYSVKLGSIIDKEQRSYYIKENFKLLKMRINELLMD